MTLVINIECPGSLIFLQPKIVSNLTRIGNSSDGGYALSLLAISNSDSILALGLGENWTFEKGISHLNPKARIDIYDDTVSIQYFAQKALKGLLKFLVFRESRRNLSSRFKRLMDYFQFWYQISTNQHHQIHITRQVFNEILARYTQETRLGLKVDIEGSEWEILNSIKDHQTRFEFVIIEIHDFENHVNELREFLEGVTDNFVISHLHANNFEVIGRTGFPNVFELTLLKISNVQSAGHYRELLPVPEFDEPNARNRPDYSIRFPVRRA